MHVHGAIYKERGLLTSEGKTIKNKSEILNLLQAVWLPEKVAVIHFPGHQKGDRAIPGGNTWANMMSWLPWVRHPCCLRSRLQGITEDLNLPSRI